MKFLSTLASIALLIELGCGSSAPVAPAPLLPATSSTLAPESPPVPTAPPPVPPVPPVSPAPPGPEIAADCRGAALDLGDLEGSRFRAPKCVVTAEAQPLPVGVTVGVEPAQLAVAPGRTSKAALLVTNTTAHDVTLLLPSGCASVGEVTTVVRDNGGKRVDRGPDECVTGGDCGKHVAGLVLTAGGTARIGFEVLGWTVDQNQDCRDTRGRNLRPGAYTLEVTHVLGKFVVPVTVK